ncbi:rhodanese-like domain-containing protein [Nocardioides sp.]|uniref:rhodanese-like domain-containing protein n=1 Tax=Nocardioides sp. TaxID=35761 RepID=UPI0035134313
MSISSITVSDVPDDLPDGTVLLDVREVVEWQAGHAPNAVHLPLSTLPVRIGDVPAGRLLVICKAGGRSAQAVQYLTQHGHDAVNVDGGMLDWEAAGRPMVSEDGQDPQVI